MNASMNPLKFGYRILYYIIMFGIFFQFFAYPVYAMVEHFPYVAKSKYYIHYESPDDYLNSEAAKRTEPKEAAANNAASKTKPSSKSYRLSAPSAVSHAEETTIEIFSQDKSGTIGYANNSNSDDPSDNIFSFNIEKQILAEKEIRLSYEVYGIENVSGISRSINENNATGGYVVKKNSKWNHLEETISLNQLKDGVNHLLFTAFENKSANYKVKNVSIKAVPIADQKLVALADGAVVYTKDNKAYLKGSVLTGGFDLYVNNEKVAVKNNEFETIVAHASGTNQIDLQLKKQGTVVYSEQVQLTEASEAAVHTFKKAEGYSLIKELDDKSYGFTLEEVGFNIKKESYEKVEQITVQKLRAIDLAPLGTNIINVTQNKSGYRFLPEGAKFKENAQVTVKFDKTLLPSGYNAQDVKILYFDMDQRRWLSVPTDTIMADQDKVVGLTDHFTDYIAGIIQSPESPETSSFTPTSISDIQVANPTANIVQVQPPTANQKGDGTLEFPINVPAGRNGMQPNLSVSYNNNGSSGPFGYGWDIAYPYISVETKYGVPVYDPQKETESYLLNGEELMMESGSGYYQPQRSASSSAVPNRTGSVKMFYPKVEGSFSKIQRIGSSPSTYTWVVWDKSGTKYQYDMPLRGSSSTNIGKWYLTRVTDKNGNYIQYYPHVETHPTGNLSGGVEMRLMRIEYTHHQNHPFNDPEWRIYKVQFEYKKNNYARPDANFNYRYGFKEVNAGQVDYIKVTCDRHDDIALNKSCNYDVEYHFNYGNGAFGKRLLNSITTKNLQKIDNGNQGGAVTGTEEYTHNFEYYNDAAGGLFGAEETIPVTSDFPNEKHATLSSTIEDYTTSEINFGAGFTVLPNPPAYLPFSYGGTINFGFPTKLKTDSSPSMMLLDIDGDGLDDKVVKIGNTVKYRKNINGTGFSQNLYQTHHISDLGFSESTTKSDKELSLSLMFVNLNASKSHTNNISRTFLADVNSDGLIDFVSDKIVYFNRIDPNSGAPTFTCDSSLTPNLILKEGAVDPGISPPLPPLSTDGDFLDVVKVWVAPKPGQIEITGDISKAFVASNNGIRYSIETSADNAPSPWQIWHPNRSPIKINVKVPLVPWNPSSPLVLHPIPFPNYTKDYLLAPTLLVNNTQSISKTATVNTGDHIYFRVNSSQEPNERVNVNWDPVIKYISPTSSAPSKFSEAFLYGDSVLEALPVFEPGNYRIQWPHDNTLNLDTNVEITVRGYKLDQNGNKTALSGSSSGNITLDFIKSKNLPSRNLQVGPVSWSTNIDTDNPDTYGYVDIEVTAKGPVNWKRFDSAFMPKLININIPNDPGRYIVPRYLMQDDPLTYYPKSVFPAGAVVSINNAFSLPACQGENECNDKVITLIVTDNNGTIPMATNGLAARFEYRVNDDGNIIGVKQYANPHSEESQDVSTAPAFINPNPGIEYSFEYYTDNYLVATALNHYQNNSGLLHMTYDAPMQSPHISGVSGGFNKGNISTLTPEESGLGTLYKGWGQFAYKGANPDQNFTPIEKSFISRNALAGTSSKNTPSAAEQSAANGIKNQLQNATVEDLEYDFENDKFKVGGANVSLNENQQEAMKHFVLLRSDRADSAWSLHKDLFVGSSEMSPYLSYENEGKALTKVLDPTANCTYGAVSIVKESYSESKSQGASIGFGTLTRSKSKSNGITNQMNDYFDVNGDGYPDIVGSQIQLTTPRGGLSTANYLNKGLMTTTTSSGSGDGLGGGTAHIATVLDKYGNSSAFKIGTSTSFSVNAGLNEFKTDSKPEGALVDINGDGLIDLIKENGVIELNTAKSYVPSMWTGYNVHKLSETRSHGYSVGGGIQQIVGKSLSNLDLSLGISGSTSNTYDKNDFVDFNGDGLPDYISGNGISFNYGTYHSSYASLPYNSKSSSTAFGTTVNLSVLIPIQLAILPFIIKVGGGGGKSWGSNLNQQNVSFRDFDGDGYTDIVRSDTENEVKVQFSKIRRTNMLKQVKNPTGSVITMDYATENTLSKTPFGPNYKMPFKKWVLSEVKVNDNFAGDGENEQHYAFEYQNGLKDRRERKFLGFGEVTTYQLDKNGGVYRSNMQEYVLNDMTAGEVYLAGNSSDSRKYQYIGNLLKRETTKDGMNRLLSVSENEYSYYSLQPNASASFTTNSAPSVTYTDTSRILPLVNRTKSMVFHYNGNSTSVAHQDLNSSVFETYDRYGNVTFYLDEYFLNGAAMTYHYIDTPTKYIVNIPASHRVGGYQRYSTTEIDPNTGNITKIHRYKDYSNNPAEKATTDLAYDSLGNLTQVTLPAALNNQRMSFTYVYDNTFKQFVTQVTDAYGFSSSTVYDHFGMPLVQTDINGVQFINSYDPLRRVKEFKGPYNNHWTIRNEYKTVPGSNLRYAITKHNIFDEFATPGEQVLHTSSFADGLGRIIQTKKQLALEQDPNCTTPGSGYRFAVSGRQVYDEFGRVIESYLGQERIDCNGVFNDFLETYTGLTHTIDEKSSVTYDMQDRVIQNHVHGLNATTSFEYGAEQDHHYTTRSFEQITLPEGNRTKTFKDERGRVTNTWQIDTTTGNRLSTLYFYNNINELLSVKDADNQTTSYTYDNFGQKTQTVHPDNGRSKFEYDLSGKLTKSTNQNLINAGNKWIVYDYNFNQLTNINYPAFIDDHNIQHSQYDVSYTYGTAVGNKGKVIHVNDLTGERDFTYGALGEVTAEQRLLTSQTGNMMFNTQYRYDSWGRILELTYPDGEKVNYGYNSVGQLKSIQSNDQIYLKDVKYNFFDQPTEILYGNDMVTLNEYDITQRVRAMQLNRPDQYNSTLMRSVYSYDRNQNITQIRNGVSQHDILQLGGVFDKNYTYDKFNRLKVAKGGWSGYKDDHQFELKMEYNNTHGIVKKDQYHTSSLAGGETNNSYRADYSYNSGRPHAVEKIEYNNIMGSQSAVADFTYDANGNMLNYDTNFGRFSTRDMVWDAQNRLAAVIDNESKASHYIYDHAGERTFKSEGNINIASVGGQDIYSVLDYTSYVMYPSGYMVVDANKDEYSKHYYINGKRFASRLQPGINQFVYSSKNANSNAQASNQLSGLGQQMGVQNTTYSINIGNNEADCLLQINALRANYVSVNNPSTYSVQHCINEIDRLKNLANASTTDTYTMCEALKEINKYVCVPVTPGNPGTNTPNPTPNPGNVPGAQQTDCLTELNILINQFRNSTEAQQYYSWYTCTVNCFETNREFLNANFACYERLIYGDGILTGDCLSVIAGCGCINIPDEKVLDSCPVKALMYIDNNLRSDLTNSCAVYNYVINNFDCVDLPGSEAPHNPHHPDIDDDWKDDTSINGPAEDGPYDEYLRKPIWWYHTDHLGSSTYLTDYFGRPSHYYETLPFGEMMVEHNQSANVQSGVGYDNKFKFNGKELDDATQMYYYGARYYDPRISIFVSVDPLAEQTMTPYQYVHNNPIMFTDPTGMSAEGPGDGNKERPNWASRTWSTIKSWFRGGSEYQSIPKNNPKSKSPIEFGELEFNGYELEAGDSWYENGVTSTVVNSTTVVNQPNVGDPYYSFIYPSDMGSWGQAGSDGKIWIGCMSCHGDNGAYREAAYNSQEALAGHIAAFVLNSVIFGGNISAAKTSETHLRSTVGAARSGFSKLPKGFKETKEFGYQHGQKVYQYKNKFYSRDIDSHNGGAWKVFENNGGRLNRIGTADEFLNIFKQ
ncbi:RHS repeat-associated core domain-containing protein [Paenimyroides baculatum]|uniref:Insecticide toxin TcdB middle/N-terminal domain-containing protein n=1 Tax=Paenimyroides baculatum TaxID=2608000 RepID=A0A5M6CNN4_9FLAO|nr:RHS repeat-associated core domain-containing protein [Paenimyroides baculatum]KAA5535582.1 hypothetical protein F0460_07320 [Paenimyroides baculatum]